MRKLSAGFTLLEILVVLVLTSLVTGILLQGLQQVFRLQRHFGTEMFHAQHEAMRINWLRNSINGIMPDYDDGKSRFKGESRRMSGQTTMPLDSPDGALVPFVWRMEFDPRAGEMALFASERTEVQPILTWPGNDGRFLYVDDKGISHESWPPFSGKVAQVPQTIVLEMGATGTGRKIVSVPRGPDVPWPRQIDL